MFAKLKDGSVVELEDGIMLTSIPPQYVTKDGKGVPMRDITYFAETAEGLKRAYENASS